MAGFVPLPHPNNWILEGWQPGWVAVCSWGRSQSNWQQKSQLADHTPKTLWLSRCPPLKDGMKLCLPHFSLLSKDIFWRFILLLFVPGYLNSWIFFQLIPIRLNESHTFTHSLTHTLYCKNTSQYTNRKCILSKDCVFCSMESILVFGHNWDLNDT